MKILRLITILLGVVALASTVAVLCDIHSRRVVDSEVSEVYRHYVGRPDLKVGFVKDYRVDDSITVDVTTITAKDSAGWEALLRELNVSEYTITIQREARKEGIAAVTTDYRLKQHPDIRVSMGNDNKLDLLFFSYQDQIVFIFDVESKDQANRISNYKSKDYINQVK